MKKDELKIADWANTELRRKRRAERRVAFFNRVRATFVLLFLLAFCVFVSNRQVETQILAFEKVHHAVNALPPSSLSDKLRQNAINYEKQVDDAGK
jgi:hypothetical protein